MTRWWIRMGIYVFAMSPRVFAQTGASPWAQASASFYDGVVGTYLPYALALVLLTGLIASRYMSDDEGIMSKVLNVGVKGAIGGGALGLVTFFGAAPTAGSTLDVVP